MAKVWIDGREHEVDGDRNMLDVALGLGLDLPYFCWHPAMGSVGACRLCAVKQFRDADDGHGKIAMACMTPAQDGTRIAIDDVTAQDFRRSVIEWLMVNHPHDCPICDEGGECHLQDMTVMTGHSYREFRFDKRTFRNQDLGPLINHEMNRCIQCYRCVRFYRDHAGGHDLQDFAIHDHVYFGRHTDGTLQSEFAGNLVEVCPTGVFTDKAQKRHYVRKWDLQTAPSVCVHCSLGCNTIPGERDGTLRRIRARYHDEVNGYFLCDRGRYGHEFVNHERRVRAPLLPAGEAAPAMPIATGDAVQRVAQRLRKHPEAVVGIGSPRASLEANHALRRLVGGERFYHGVSPDQARLAAAVRDVVAGGPWATPSLRAVEHHDAVLLLGENVPDTAPLLSLALRQAARRQPARRAAELKIPAWHDLAVRDVVQDDHGPLHVATPAATRLDDLATTKLRAQPADVAQLGRAVARALDPELPPVDGLPDAVAELAGRIADDLRHAERPLVVSGAGCGDIAVVHAAAMVARACCKARGDATTGLFCTLPEANSLGLALLHGAGDLHGAVAAVEQLDDATLLIIENDLTRRAPAELVARLLDAAGDVVVVDHLAHGTAARADLLLPAATFAECGGTLVNNEGRAQRHHQVFVPAGEVQASWRWLRDIGRAAGHDAASGWERLADVVADLAGDAAEPWFARLPELDVDLAGRPAAAPVPRAPHRYSGRTAMHADESVREPRHPADPDAPLAFSMEGYQGTPPTSLEPHFWAPGWNSPQGFNRFQQEIAGPLRDGPSGIRLLDDAGRDEPVEEQPAALEPVPAGSLRTVALHHVFGSEELSALAPGVAALAPAPYVALHPDDAAARNLDAGDDAALHLGSTTLHLPVHLRDDLAPGSAGLPVGLAGIPGGDLPPHAEVARP